MDIIVLHVVSVRSKIRMLEGISSSCGDSKVDLRITISLSPGMAICEIEPIEQEQGRRILAAPRNGLFTLHQ